MKIQIPDKNSTMEYMEFIKDTVDLAGLGWTYLADSCLVAYGTAYSQQEHVLKEIKEQVEADRKKEEAMASFCLSLVLVAVSGPAAGALAGKLKITEGMAASAFTTWLDKTVEEGFKTTIEKGSEAGLKLLYPETQVNSVYEPASVVPEVYWSGMHRRIVEKQWTIKNCINESSYVKKLDKNEARKLVEVICNSSFVKEAPRPDSVNDSLLLKKASLGLWLNWLYARDYSYWRGATFAMNREVHEYAPVGEQLEALGVPDHVVWMGDFSSEERAAMREAGRSPMNIGYQMSNCLNFAELIQWATGPEAIELLFKGVPHREDTDIDKYNMMLKMNFHRLGYA